MVVVLVAAAVAAYALTRGGTQEVPANGTVDLDRRRGGAGNDDRSSTRVT